MGINLFDMNRQTLMIFLAAVMIFCAPGAMAQPDFDTITVPLQITLTEEPVSRGLVLPVPEKYAPDLTGLPVDMDTVLYWSIYTNWKQNIYELHQRGGISDAEFAKRNISPEDYTLDNIRHSISACSGFRNGKKIIVLDTNHNGDMSDETVVELDTAISFEERIGDDYKLTPWFRLEYDYYQDGEIYPLSATGRLDPFLYLINPADSLYPALQFSFQAFEQYRGTVRLGNKKYNLTAPRDWPSGDPGGIQFSNYGKLPSAQEDAFLKVEIGQKIFIDDSYYEIAGFDRRSNHLKIRPLPLPSGDQFIGGRVGMKAPEFQREALFSKETVRLGGKQERYTFIHAWGTWCGPCRADHPELVRLYQQYKDRDIHFVGLAVDSDPQKVTDYMQKEHMVWDNLFFSRQEPGDPECPVTQLYITGYPTYLIVDKSGTIIFRGEIPELKKEFEKLLVAGE